MVVSFNCHNIELCYSFRDEMKIVGKFYAIVRITTGVWMVSTIPVVVNHQRQRCMLQLCVAIATMIRTDEPMNLQGSVGSPLGTSWIILFFPDLLLVLKQALSKFTVILCCSDSQRALIRFSISKGMGC